MRTTINIDHHLLIEVKTVAARSGRSMSAIIEDALRMALSERVGTRSRHIELPTFDGGGLRPGVDLDDTSALLDLMDERR